MNKIPIINDDFRFDCYGHLLINEDSFIDALDNFELDISLLHHDEDSDTEESY